MVNTKQLSNSSRNWISLLSLWGIIVLYLLALDLKFTPNELMQTTVAIHLASALYGAILVALIADTKLSADISAVVETNNLMNVARVFMLLTVVGASIVNQDISALIIIYAGIVYTAITFSHTTQKHTQ